MCVQLALRAGNEKDEDSADTVGCCSLRVEHITLHRRLDGEEHVVEFDFLGKDSIRYYNKVPVEKQVKCVVIVSAVFECVVIVSAVFECVVIVSAVFKCRDCIGCV